MDPKQAVSNCNIECSKRDWCTTFIAGHGKQAGFCFLFGRNARKQCEIDNDQDLVFYHKGVLSQK